MKLSHIYNVKQCNLACERSFNFSCVRIKQKLVLDPASKYNAEKIMEADKTEVAF